MSENLHNIDKLFKDRIEQHEEEPSLNVWDAIDNNLDKRKVVSISKKYNKLKWAAVMLLLFSFGMAMYIFQIRKTNKDLVKKNNVEKPLKNNNDSLRNNAKDFNEVQEDNTDLRKNEELKGNTISQDTTKEKASINEFKDERTNKLSDQTGSQIVSKENGTIKTFKKTGNIYSENKEKNITESVEKNKGAGLLNKEPDKGAVKDLNQQSLSGNKYFSSIPQIFLSPEMKPHKLFAVSLLNPEAISPNVFPNNIITIENVKDLKEKNKTAKSSMSKTSGRSLFSATLFFSPDITGYRIESDHPRFREDDKDEIEKNEDPRFSSTVGFLIGYNLNKNWRLQSGATLFTRATNIDSKTIYARQNSNGDVDFRLSCFSGSSFIPLKSGNQPNPGDSAIASAKNSLQYIGVPVMLQYNISKGKFSINPGAGLAVNFLLKNKIATVINTSNGKESASTNVQGLKSSYLNGSISLGAEYKLSESFALSFVPTARFALSSINKGEPVKTTLNSVGFATGVSFKF